MMTARYQNLLKNESITNQFPRAEFAPGPTGGLLYIRRDLTMILCRSSTGITCHILLEFQVRIPIISII
jgi:hypothetical protein